MNLIEILKYWADKYSFDDEDINVLNDVVLTLQDEQDEFADEDTDEDTDNTELVDDFSEDYSDNEEV